MGGIHRSFSPLAQRLAETTVESGVTLGNDLRLGGFSGTGEAGFIVSATWNPADRAPDRRAPRDARALARAGPGERS
ncbi:hypothetical protein OG289_04710 [Streptomyces sp. NBC_01235]|nr:hypothetical protein OG289_04710 [Streptomyces sp. NBC_01235]